MEYENLQKNSVKKDKTVRKEKRKSVAKSVLATALAGLMISGASAGYKNNQKQQKIKEAKASIIYDIYKDGNVASIVSRNTYQLYDGHGNYAYNTRGIAEDVAPYLEEKPENTNDVLYCVHSDMDHNKDKNLVEVFESLSIIVNNDKEKYDDLYAKLAGTNSLEEYLVKEKLVDEEGKASTDKLEDVFYLNVDYYINNAKKDGVSKK